MEAGVDATERETAQEQAWRHEEHERERDFGDDKMPRGRCAGWWWTRIWRARNEEQTRENGDGGGGQTTRISRVMVCRRGT